MKKLFLCGAMLAIGCGYHSRGGSYPLPFESTLYERVRDADCVSPTGVPILTRPLSRADCAALALRCEDKDLADAFAGDIDPHPAPWHACSSFFITSGLRADVRDGEFEPDNDLGRVYEEGCTPRLPVGGGAMFGDWLALTGQVEFAFTEPESGSKPYEYQYTEASARLFARKWEIMAGREPIWFGPGRHGSLLVSSNARPLKMIKFSNHEPILLPWGLEGLGPMRLTIFRSKLDPRPAPVGRPEFGGMRVEFRPTPRFSFGLSRTAIFGGDDKTVDLEYLWDLFWAISSNEPTGTGDNQKAGFDLRYVAGLGSQPVEFYVEAAGEDEATSAPSKWATVMGMHLPSLGHFGGVRLTVEWASNTWSGDDVWYQDYTYHDTLLGHHMGPDAQDLFVSLGLGNGEKWGTEIWYDHERRNVLGPADPVAHKDEWGVKLNARFPRMDVYLGYAWQRFVDCLPGEEVVSGARETGSLFSMGLSSTF